MADEDSAGSGAPKPEPRADSAAPGEPRPPAPSPRQQAEPKGESSSPASPTAINTADGASAAVSGGETMAAGPKTAEDGGGGAACSFSQLLAGAMGSAAAAGAVPILAVPVDAARVSVVAVPCFIAPASLLNSPGFTGQFAMTHQAVLATVTAQAQLQLLLQQGAQPSSSSDSLTNSSPQPSGSAITTLPLQQRPPPIPEENVCTPEVEQSPSPHQKPRSSRIFLRTNSSDGYNWRKYGQKQVKSSDISRSYYRCANSDCFVKKKVQHFQDGRVIEIVYKGCHNHDPPQKTRFSKEKRSLSAGPLVESEDLEPPGGELNESHATLKAEQDCSNTSPEQQFHCSSDCEEDSGVKTEDLADKPEPKRRLCEITTPSLAPLLKTVKEPKIVMQSAGDLGLVNDGYKWRKYGQKFVKGNSNPRSYYRCTQVGCPVRKHVERSKDDATAFRITYEGKHNHDQPSPRNGGDPPTAAVPAATAAVPAATAAVTNAGQIETSRCLSDQKPMPEQWHHADEKINDDKHLGREKALESAQTLLSIGEASRNNSEGIPRPLFDEIHAAVPVQNS